VTAKEKFNNNYRDVENLFVIHNKLTGGVQGKNRNLTPSLLKSGVIFICACWEAFVEDVCRDGGDWIVAEVIDPSNLPNGIKAKIAEELKSAKNPIDLWNLSGDNWKQLVRGKVEMMCDGLAGGLNTPNYKNVRALMKDIFGIPDIKLYWSWQGMMPDQAAKKLDDLVALRGALAHGGSVAGSLSIGLCQTYNNHIKALVETTDSAVSKARALMKLHRLHK
jgi:hypothetical protein